MRTGIGRGGKLTRASEWDIFSIPAEQQPDLNGISHERVHLIE